jgi:hypothetical protein
MDTFIFWVARSKPRLSVELELFPGELRARGLPYETRIGLPGDGQSLPAEATLFDLHLALHEALTFGFYGEEDEFVHEGADEHLHRFIDLRLGNPYRSRGAPHDERNVFLGEGFLGGTADDDWQGYRLTSLTTLSSLGLAVGDRLLYEYDMGDKRDVELIVRGLPDRAISPESALVFGDRLRLVG